jgi:hypothetical protein
MAKKVQLRYEASDENPKIVSFPGGVPLQAQHMAITAQAKGAGKKRKFNVEGLLLFPTSLVSHDW